MTNLYYRRVNQIEYDNTPVRGYNGIEAFLTLLNDTCGSYWRSDDGEGNIIEVEREDLTNLAHMLTTMDEQEFNDTCYVDLSKMLQEVGVATKEELAQMVTSIAEGAEQRSSVVCLDIF